ncbi:cell envelope biogenesis protein OmpA [Sphingomonas paeninsulae]|uniref:Cell envelope biogenesis protein OmpA n=2 Tax=Sphingomonas paeninsulae TaxID=2319844 RepID=A0A494TCS6_SPHPE|nr:cell envelope biogenesis protein OmpA [Sphingomonas paeninsulae]
MRRRFPLFWVTLGAALLLAGCQTIQRPTSPWTQQQVATLRAQGFEETTRGWELSVSDKLLFGSSDSNIGPKEQSAIANIASALKSVGLLKLSAEGHADSTGNAAYNLTLSSKRAHVVADALIAGGIRSEDLSVVGLGTQAPVESNATATGRRENRRVVIIVGPQD